jgi:hypothetical protein
VSIHWLAPYRDTILGGPIKGPSTPHAGRVCVEPFEFTSNGEGEETLSRRGKRLKASFYEVINLGLKAAKGG